MYLLESIRIYNGRIYNLAYHQARFNKTQKELFGLSTHQSLRKSIQIPKTRQRGLVKCRVRYAQDIESITFESYKPRKIHSLKLVPFHASYAYKYEDRTDLHAAFQNKEDCSDVILVKDGWLTDSYYANLAFKKNEKWYTPSHSLLAGTQRQKLLDKKRILRQDIALTDLDKYSHVSLFNSMILFKQIILRIDSISD